jgi:hypothetical protein
MTDYMIPVRQDPMIDSITEWVRKSAITMMRTDGIEHNDGEGHTFLKVTMFLWTDADPISGYVFPNDFSRVTGD